MSDQKALREHYAALSNAELLALQADYASLSEEARPLLSEELRRRNLTRQLPNEATGGAGTSGVGSTYQRPQQFQPRRISAASCLILIVSVVICFRVLHLVVLPLLPARFSADGLPRIFTSGVTGGVAALLWLLAVHALGLQPPPRPKKHKPPTS